jgi:hypothetical protein
MLAQVMRLRLRRKAAQISGTKLLQLVILKYYKTWLARKRVAQRQSW